MEPKSRRRRKMLSDHMASGAQNVARGLRGFSEPLRGFVSRNPATNRHAQQGDFSLCGVCGVSLPILYVEEEEGVKTVLSKRNPAKPRSFCQSLSNRADSLRGFCFEKPRRLVASSAHLARKVSTMAGMVALASVPARLPESCLERKRSERWPRRLAGLLSAFLRRGVAYSAGRLDAITRRERAPEEFSEKVRVTR